MSDKPAAVEDRSVLASVAGMVLVIVVFFVAWFAGGLLFHVIDQIRGLGNDRLQAVFRTLFVPGASGYLAIASVKRWLPTASVRGVFWGCVGLVVVFLGVYVTFLLSPTRRVELAFWEGAIPILVLASGVFGGYMNAKPEL